MSSELELFKEELLKKFSQLSIQNSQLPVNTTSLVGVHGHGNISAQRDIINLNISYSNSDPQPSQPASKSKRKTHINLRCPSDYFTGRQNYLDKLDRKLTTCLTQTKLKDRTVVIYGLGGVGKTEIVREYATKPNTFENVIVIDAFSSKTAEKCFQDIAANVLKLPLTNIEDTITSVYRFFAQKTNEETLFIFENAEKLTGADDTSFVEFLPTMSLGEMLKIPVVLIISRHKDWKFPKRNHMEIHPWKDVEAVQYLTHHFEDQELQVTENVKRSMDTLGSYLQCYPLGLSIAISNIRKDQENAAVDKILNYLRVKEENPDAWRFQEMHDTAFNSYKLTMDTVFNADIEKIHLNKSNGVQALQLLRIVSNQCPLHPERNPMITCLEMHNLCTNNGISTDVVEALRLLFKYSIFVRHDNEEGRLLSSQIHNVIQLCKSKWIESYLANKIAGIDTMM